MNKIILIHSKCLWMRLQINACESSPLLRSFLFSCFIYKRSVLQFKYQIEHQHQHFSIICWSNVCRTFQTFSAWNEINSIRKINIYTIPYGQCWKMNKSVSQKEKKKRKIWKRKCEHHYFKENEISTVRCTLYAVFMLLVSVSVSASASILIFAFSQTNHLINVIVFVEYLHHFTIVVTLHCTMRDSSNIHKREFSHSNNWGIEILFMATIIRQMYEFPFVFFECEVRIKSDYYYANRTRLILNSKKFPNSNWKRKLLWRWHT